MADDFNESEQKALGALYAGPLETFIKRRKTLAADLKTAGRIVQSERVGKLKKPSAVAARVNHLAHEHAKELAGLLEASRLLREAQARRGASAGAREAMEKERQALARVLDADPSLTDANLRARVRSTVLAHAHGSEALREQLRQGRLEAELQEAGFGFEAAADALAAAPSASEAAGPDAQDSPSPAPVNGAAQREEAVAQQRALAQKRERLSAEIDQARTRLRALEAAAEAAETAARMTRERAGVAQAEVVRLEAELGATEALMTASRKN